MTGSRNTGLDVVRAAAVLTVVAVHGTDVFHTLQFVGGPQTWFHAMPSWLHPMSRWLSPLAPVAVEVFYALSGLLIGRILLDLAAAPTAANWFRFMARRWTRTLPLYFVLLALMAVSLQPDPLELLRYATMSQNVVGAPAHSTLNWMLVPSWSLTVEEIFYLTFAATMLGSAAAFGQRAVWPTIIAFLALPALFRVSQIGVQDTYFAALGNLDGIAAGVVLAQLQCSGSRMFRFPKTCLLAGTGLVAFAWFPYASGIIDAGTAWNPGSFTVASAGCCLLVAAAMSVTGSLGFFGILARAVSLRSYSIYLIHIPVFTVAKVFIVTGDKPVFTSIAVAVLFLVGLSYAAHRWIELPGMKIRLPSRLRAPRILRAAAP
jgi:peptidoglycan/LPS O-acetylase OafA/YrhL